MKIKCYKTELRTPKFELKEQGFTLLEVLLALGILSIGLLGLLGMQVTGMKGNSFGMEMTQATTIGTEGLEDAIDGLATGAMTCAVSPAPDNPVRNGVTFTRTWTFTVNGSTCDVQVVVTWSDKWVKNRTVTLNTVRDI